MEVLRNIVSGAPCDTPQWSSLVENARYALAQLNDNNESVSHLKHSWHPQTLANIILANSSAFALPSAFTEVSDETIAKLNNEVEFLLSVLATSATMVNDLVNPDLKSVPSVNCVAVRDLFVGRDQLVTSTVASLKGSAHPKNLICLYGPHGSGKAKLARTVAQTLEAENFHPVFVSVRSKNTELIMAEVLHIVAPGLRDSTSPVSISTLFYRATSLPGVLLVLEHATQPSHIKALVNACGSKHIIATFDFNSSQHTSEMEEIFSAASTNALWGGAHVTHQRIGGLTDDEALLCLSTVCPRLSTADAKSLAKHSLNIPLALVSSGAILDKYPTVEVEDWGKHLKNIRASIHQYQLKAGRNMSDNENLIVMTSLFAALQLLSKSILKILSVCILFGDYPIDARLLLFLLNAPQESSRRDERSTSSLIGFRRDRDDESMYAHLAQDTDSSHGPRGSRAMTVDNPRDKQDEQSLVFDIIDITEGLAILEEIGAMSHIDEAGDKRFQCFRVHAAVTANWDLALDMGVIAHPLPPTFTLDIAVPARASKPFLTSTTEHKARFVYHWFCAVATCLSLAQATQIQRPKRSTSNVLLHHNLPAQRTLSQLYLLHFAVHRQLHHINNALTFCLEAVDKDTAAAAAVTTTAAQEKMPSSEGGTQLIITPAPETSTGFLNPNPFHFAHLLTHENNVWGETLRMLLPSRARVALFEHCLKFPESVKVARPVRCLWYLILGDALVARNKNYLEAFQQGLKLASKDSPEDRWLHGLLALRCIDLDAKPAPLSPGEDVESHMSIRRLRETCSLVEADANLSCPPTTQGEVRIRVLLALTLFHMGKIAFLLQGEPTIALGYLGKCKKTLETVQVYDHGKKWETRGWCGNLLFSAAQDGPDPDSVLVDPACEIKCLGQLGQVYIRLGEWSESLRVHQHGLKLCRQIHDTQGEAEMCYSMGNAYGMMDNHQEALRCHEEALAKCKTTENPALAAKLQLVLGQDYVELGMSQKAKQALEQGRTALKVVEDKRGEGRCFWLLGQLHCNEAEIPMALDRDIKLKLAAELFKQSAEMYVSVDDVQNILGCYSMLSDVAEKLGSTNEALEWCNKTIELSDGNDAAIQLRMRAKKQKLLKSLQTGVVRSGWLTKQGGGTRLLGSKRWKKRWFELTQTSLTYAEQENTTPIHSIQVSNILEVRRGSDALQTDQNKRIFGFEVDALCPSPEGSKKRTFVMASESLDDQQQWVEAISETIKNSFKLM